MSRSNKEFHEARGSRFAGKLDLGVLKKTLTGTYTMTELDPPLCWFDPGGAGRTVNLPPERLGGFIIIVNDADAAESLTVKEDTSTTTIDTVAQNETTIFVCDGVTWKPVRGAAS